MDTVGFALVRSALCNSSSKVLEHAHSSVPVNARIGDGDALLEATWALCRNLLVALVDVGLDHDTNDAGLAVADLICDILSDLGLIAVVLVGVACKLLVYYALSNAESLVEPTVRAVNHHDLREVLLPQRLAHVLDARGVEVCALGSAAQDNEAVLVTTCPGDGSQTLLCDTHEVVLCGRAANRINSDGETTIGTVLETNGERETRGKLAVQLRLCCARTDRAEGDQVCEKLGRDGVEHLRRDGHAGACEINKELAGNAQTLVDLEGFVDIGVVDQALPADCCAGLLKIGAHNDADVVLQLVGEGLQALAVLESELGVVQRAGPDHDQETVILLCDDLDGFFATADDGLLGVWCDWDLGGEELGRNQRVVAKDCMAN